QKPEDHLAPQLYAPQQTGSQRVGSKTKVFMGEVVMKVSLRLGQTFIGVDRPLALLMLFSAQLRRRWTHEEVRNNLPGITPGHPPSATSQRCAARTRGRECREPGRRTSGRRVDDH